MHKKTNYKTDQESFWSGEFGTDYITRNKSDDFLEVVLEDTTIKITLKKKSDFYIGSYKNMDFISEG